MGEGARRQHLGRSLYHVQFSDPDSELIDRSGLSAADIDQINRLMGALGVLRQAEEQLSEAATRYMKLNQTDMRAVHYLIVTEHRGEVATPGSIAAHLGISTASTTKLLDRLAAGGHITREPHPSDRRALVIRITPQTRRTAMDTVGRQHATRFTTAARLSPAEREVVIGFIEDMARDIGVGSRGWASDRGQES